MTNVLSVCTGNICRSPASALLLQRYLGDLVTATSAGTRASVGIGIPAEMLTSIADDIAVGASVESHAAQQLTPQLLDDADIVIAMTAQHRGEIVRLSPAAVHRTFLLGELAQAARTHARLDGGTTLERLAHLPEAIGWFRPDLAAMHIADVPDPYGGSQADYDAAYRIIKDAILSLDKWVRADA